MNRQCLYFILILCSLIFPLKAYKSFGQINHNPLLPGYFADPTIKKFGDTYYIYLTTDGVKLASGHPTVWVSNDFTNWYNYKLDIKVPDGLTNCWAPDVVEGADGNYYYFMGNCQFGCNIYGYVSDNPIGPWLPIKNGEAVIPVGTSKAGLPALDAQFFTDDDGSVYSYFGTWCTSFGGMGWTKHDPKNLGIILKEGFIPIEQVPLAFEAPYMIKKNGKYILMYSAGNCHLSSYAVHYSWSNSPEGPFIPGTNNPILSTNDDGTIDSPGHHSMLKLDGQYYILYHRHDNPHSSGGLFRQVCADRMEFENDTVIKKIVPTHEGIAYLGENSIPHTNYAKGAEITASSSYHLQAPANRYNREPIDHVYRASFAIDNNYGTLWKAESAMLPQSLVIDLGKQVDIKRIMTNFEYSVFYYQYKIETSNNNRKWTLFADRTLNQIPGSPMIDDNEANARYIRLTITGTEKAGLFAAVWNIQVYDSLFDVPKLQNNKVNTETSALSTRSLLLNMDISKLKNGSQVDKLPNKGTLGGHFEKHGNPVIETVNGVKAVKFDGNSHLELSKKAPASLAWNSAYTASVWVYNPEVGPGECLMTWTSRRNMLMGSYTALTYGTGHYGAVAHGDGYLDIPYKTVPEAGKWHHIVVTFDGMHEKVYVNGKLDTQLPIMLFVENSTISIGASGQPDENFSGYMANVRLYDYALNYNEISKLMMKTQPKGFNQQ
jgi:xylan 1,4-beta-xylosidase